MILHTILCKEQIFPCEYTNNEEMMVRNGTPIIVEKVEDRYRIVRIMSTDPNDYLKHELSPGMYID